MKTNTYLVIGLLAVTFCWSCKKSSSSTNNTTPAPTYTIPATYNFTNINYSNQQKLIAMADQVVAAINQGNTANTTVSSQKLKDMFNNVNSYFNDSALSLNTSGLRLANYCSVSAKVDLMNYFDSIGLYSQSTVTAAHNTAGVAVSVANKKLLLSPKGVFYSQLVKKTIMGGICAYAIANVYLQDSVGNSIDNTTVTPGSGTAMEHGWDQAFGFFGVPVNFPTSTTGLKYLGSYCTQVNAGLNSNTTIMNAFLKGRAAISNKDMTTKQEQATILISSFDKLIAACVVQEMKETDENIEAGDAVGAYGTLSEALGFVRALKYNTSSTRVITDAQIAQLEALFDNSNPANPDLYNFIGTDISATATLKAKTDAIRQMVGSIYGFDANSLSLL